jgi:hypothetical protein
MEYYVVWVSETLHVSFIGLTVLIDAFAKLCKATVSFVMSVRPHGTTRLPLGVFSWNLISDCFSIICGENSFYWCMTRTTTALHEDRHSKWPRGLRHEFTVARLLGLLVRSPPTTLMSVSCECYLLSGRCLCFGLITRPEESYRLWCVWEWWRSLDNEEALTHWELLCHGKYWRSMHICNIKFNSAYKEKCFRQKL